MLETWRQADVHVDETFALYWKPAKTFDGDVEVGVAEISAFQLNWMLDEFHVFWIGIVSRSQEGSSSLAVDFISSVERSSMNGDVLRHIEIEVLLRAGENVDSAEST